MDGTRFGDTAFLLNIRIRMVRDTIRINAPNELFMERCLDDIDFIDGVLARLAEELGNPRIEIEERGPEADAAGSSGIDLIADTEWQFSQLLTGLPLDSGPFAAPSGTERKDVIKRLRETSTARRKIFERLVGTEEGANDQLVSPTELSMLFGGA